MAETLKASVALEQLGPNTFKAEPFFDRARSGNPHAIAYGGLVMSQAITAAFMSIEPSSPHHLFSVQGSYLAPSSTEVPTYFETQDMRTTRSMITRLVTASQDVDPPAGAKGSEKIGRGKIRRKTFVVILDFHAPEKSMLSYARPPMYPGTYSSPASLLGTEQRTMKLLSPNLHAIMMKQFGLLLRLFEQRPVPSSAGAQNALGFLDKGTSQDELDLVRRTNATWIRTREPLDTYSERCAALGFLMDSTLSFLPLSLSNLPLTSASVVSSLDFSLRFFCPPPTKMDESWLLLEQNTERAADGRTFSVGRMFAEDGLEIARMSQVSILRGPNGGAQSSKQPDKGQGGVAAKL